MAYANGLTNPYSAPWTYPYQAPQQPTDNLIKVHGDDGAKSYPMGPNSRAVMFDDEDDVFYLKQTDANGFPSMRKARYEFESEQSQGDFVSRQEFDDLSDRVNKLIILIQGKEVDDAE